VLFQSAQRETPVPNYECDCGAKYRFSDAHVGKQAKCKKCNKVFTLAGDSDPILVADDPNLTGEVDQVLARRAGVSPTTLSLPPGKRVIIEKSVDLIEHGPGGYWGDLLWSLLFAAHPPDLVVFLVVCAVISVLDGFFGATGSLLFFWHGVLFLIAWVVFHGWYASIRFAVVESAAGGDPHLPSMNMSGDWFDDYLVPAIQWAMSWVIIAIPAGIYAIYFVARAGPAPPASGGLLTGAPPPAFRTF